MTSLENKVVRYWYSALNGASQLEGIINSVLSGRPEVGEWHQSLKSWQSFRSRPWLKTTEIGSIFYDKVSCHEQSIKLNSLSEISRLAAQSPLTSQLRNYCLSNEQFCVLTDVNPTRQIRLRTRVQKVSEHTSHPAKNGRFHLNLKPICIF